MPIYEYRRPDGTTFEIMQRFTDEALTTDPQTGEPVQRVLHSPAVHFKGKGFYNTDYGTKKRQRELEKSGKDGAEKTEAKQADKQESKSSSSDGGGSSNTSSDTSSSGSASTAGSTKSSGTSSTSSSGSGSGSKSD